MILNRPPSPLPSGGCIVARWKNMEIEATNIQRFDGRLLGESLGAVPPTPSSTSNALDVLIAVHQLGN